ncbi:Hypothetical predicted protein [Olea europaea subsp. europaea]|uniref:Uncharacterized protein n=1 Tax=Olea europaea subsp. europaea TaxID=158383 RepID=A0A8S0QKS8_OLEEU|nr:Hypothetical predicted protein [Olea europaea subsp. europaea]
MHIKNLSLSIHNNLPYLNFILQATADRRNSKDWGHRLLIWATRNRVGGLKLRRLAEQDSFVFVNWNHLVISMSA